MAFDTTYHLWVDDTQLYQSAVSSCMNTQFQQFFQSILFVYFSLSKMVGVTWLIVNLCQGTLSQFGECAEKIQIFLHLSSKEKQEEQLLTALPPPSPLQIEAIGVAIEKVVQEFGLSTEDLEQRLRIKTGMENILRQKLPGNNLLNNFCF